MSHEGTVSWIYRLKKPALMEVCQEYELSEEGTVDELRSRLRAHLRQKEDPVLLNFCNINACD